MCASAGEKIPFGRSAGPHSIADFTPASKTPTKFRTLHKK
jgi:hypothetical protein